MGAKQPSERVRECWRMGTDRCCHPTPHVDPTLSHLPFRQLAPLWLRHSTAGGTDPGRL